MTKRKPKWVLVLNNGLSPLDGEDNSCVVGPFDSEEKAREYANSSACDGDGHFGMRAMLLLRPFSAERARTRAEDAYVLHLVEEQLIAKEAWEAMALRYFRKQIVQRLRARAPVNDTMRTDLK